MGYPPVHVERRKQRAKEALCLPLTIHSPHTRGWPMLQRVAVRSCLTTEPHRRNSEKSCWAFKTRSRTAVCECFLRGHYLIRPLQLKSHISDGYSVQYCNGDRQRPGGEWEINHDFVLLFLSLFLSLPTFWLSWFLCVFAHMLSVDAQSHLPLRPSADAAFLLFFLRAWFSICCPASLGF